ncbi:MAG: hypothetical protein NWS47_03715 [Alphaproteobacteria bacterium]|nr:hypothetical protein [Alphaproteobacteria bacterium]
MSNYAGSAKELINTSFVIVHDGRCPNPKHQPSSRVGSYPEIITMFLKMT